MSLHDKLSCFAYIYIYMYIFAFFFVAKIDFSHQKKENEWQEKPIKQHLDCSAPLKFNLPYLNK